MLLNHTIAPTVPVDIQVGIVLVFFFVCLFFLFMLAMFLFSGRIFSGCAFVCKAVYLKCCLRCCRPCTRTYEVLAKKTQDFLVEQEGEEEMEEL